MIVDLTLPEDLLAALADRTSWDAIGYEPFPLGSLSDTPVPATVPTVELLAARDAYDVVVVGSGAGGGVAARVLAEWGASVLVVERGGWVDRDARTMDHLRNHRLPVLGDGTSPVGHPRAVARSSGERLVEPADPAYHNNAIAIGGGTRMFGAQAWRFHPDDFRMASLYGVPEGSALADWPLGYDDLAPYYRKVEWDLGVAGDADYPMAPFAPAQEDRLIARLDRYGPTGSLTLDTTQHPDDFAAAMAAIPAELAAAVDTGTGHPLDARHGLHLQQLIDTATARHAN